MFTPRQSNLKTKAPSFTKSLHVDKAELNYETYDDAATVYACIILDSKGDNAFAFLWSSLDLETRLELVDYLIEDMVTLEEYEKAHDLKEYKNELLRTL